MTEPKPRAERASGAFLVVQLYAAAGPLLGAICFIMATLLIGSPTAATSESYSGQGVVAMIAFSPLIFFGAFVVAWVPAAATGLILAIEYVVRGRVSWLLAGLTPIAMVYLYNQIAGRAPDDWIGQLSYPLGVAASLMLRTFFRHRLGGMTSASVTASDIAFGGAGILSKGLGQAVLALRSWRARLVLFYALTLPPIAGLITVICMAPHTLWIAMFGVFIAYILFGVQAISSALLLALVSRGRRVLLLNAAWTPLPGSIFILLTTSEQHLATLYVMMAACSVASVLAATTFRHFDRIRSSAPV